VGVKNGINAFGKKNFLGTFQPPFAVLNDSNFLKSLTLRVWRSGIAEAVKVSLIKDPEFFSFLEQNSTKLCERDLPGMEHLVYRCAELHLNHIAKGGDPFEQGSSRPLDFGHWAAHKLEQLTHHRLLHGEAVAIGIAIDSTYSYLTGLLSKQSWERVIKLLSRLGFELHVPEMNDPNSLLSGLEEFREHLGGELTIMLLKDIGTGVEVNKVDTEKLVESIKLLYTV
jgi:3-dehydroquinate synthase